MITCLIDQTTHENEESLHLHLKKFKIKQSDYYEEYVPRHDLLTGEKIPYKSFDQYFSSHFCNKGNMKEWFKQNPEKSSALAVVMLEERNKKKKWSFAPTEIELISAGLPSIGYYDKHFDYNSLCKNLELKTRHDYRIENIAFHDKTLSIIMDTREDKPFHFKKHQITERGLKFGDYALEGEENKVVVERKSLMDFIGSFVKDFARVEREFQRAKEAGAYLIVVCEEDLNTALNFNYIPFVKKFTKMKPEVVFHNVRNLLQRYDCQFVFCKGKRVAADIVEKIFLYDGDIRRLDLQYYIDRKKTF